MYTYDIDSILSYCLYKMKFYLHFTTEKNKERLYRLYYFQIKILN